MLAIESSEVVALRLFKFASGDADAFDEAEIMVGEKFGAGAEAFTSLLHGASSLAIINRFRELVAANYGRLRLSAEM